MVRGCKDEFVTAEVEYGREIKRSDVDRKWLLAVGDDVFFIFLSSCQPRGSSARGLSEEERLTPFKLDFVGFLPLQLGGFGNLPKFFLRQCPHLQN